MPTPNATPEWNRLAVEHERQYLTLTRACADAGVELAIARCKVGSCIDFELYAKVGQLKLVPVGDNPPEDMKKVAGAPRLLASLPFDSYRTWVSAHAMRAEIYPKDVPCAA